jgi:hypothetical protein
MAGKVLMMKRRRGLSNSRQKFGHEDRFVSHFSIIFRIGKMGWLRQHSAIPLNYFMTTP